MEDNQQEQQEQQEQKEQVVEMHTEHEAELTRQIAELNATIKNLQETNRKMFMKLSGQGTEVDEETIDAKIDRMIFEHLHAYDYNEMRS